MSRKNNKRTIGAVILIGAGIHVALAQQPVVPASAAPAAAPAEFEAKRKQLERFREQYKGYAATGGWTAIPEGAKIEPGKSDPRVPALRARIVRTEGMSAEPAPADTNLYDSALAAKVKAFQRRHGLKDDAIVGRGTIQALNVPAEFRAHQIQLAIDRLGQEEVPTQGAEIRVNLPSYELEIYEDGKAVKRMRVIIGKTYRPTPLLSSRVTHVSLNPTWHVPVSLARTDILAKMRRSPEKMAETGFQAFLGSEQVDLTTVDWKQVSPSRLPYQFRQLPGSANALGRILFYMPNGDDIYLHDTPTRYLFAADQRAQSSGCIRLEKPIELAEYLLNSKRWDAEKIEAAIETGQAQQIFLQRQMNVRFVYHTAWVDSNGELQLREDVYGHDKRALQPANPLKPAMQLAAVTR